MQLKERNQIQFNNYCLPPPTQIESPFRCGENAKCFPAPEYYYYILIYIYMQLYFS